MLNVPFIDAKPGASRSARARQLEVSRVRSYTATVGHRKRKAREAGKLGTSKSLSHRLPLLSPIGHSRHQDSVPLHQGGVQRSFAHLFTDSPSTTDGKPSAEQEDTQSAATVDDQAIVPSERRLGLVSSAFDCYGGKRTRSFGHILERSSPQKDEYSINVSPASRHRNSSDIMQQTSWLWTHGLRSDPFECIPGSREPSAALAVDYCMCKGLCS